MQEAVFKATMMRMLDDKDVREILDGIIRHNINGAEVRQAGVFFVTEEEQPRQQDKKIFNLVVNDKRVNGVHKAIILLLVGVPWIWGVIKLWEVILS